MNERDVDVAIIGAGISGLATARHLVAAERTARAITAALPNALTTEASR